MWEVLEGVLKEGCMAHSFVVALCWEKRVAGNGKVKKHADALANFRKRLERICKTRGKKEWEVDN